jgi:fluoroacetyl-CoA thioesterase
MEIHQIREGLSTTYTHVISSEDAFPFTSAVLDFLLSTPAVAALVIKVSSALLEPLLSPGYITVGKSISLTHDKPTVVGEEVSLTVTVMQVRHNTVLLEFVGRDRGGIFCRGFTTRGIVKKQQLVESAYQVQDEKYGFGAR